MKRTLVTLGLLLSFAARPATAGWLDQLKGCYTFDTQTNGVVSNAVNAVGYPGGFAQDAAFLSASYAPTSYALPYTTNPAKVLAGTGALDGSLTNQYGSIAGNPVNIAQDWSVATWFKPSTGGLGITNSSGRMMVFETSGGWYPISYGLNAGTGVTNTTFQLFTIYSNGTASASSGYVVASNLVDQWHHIVVVHSNTNLFGYLDGALVHSINLTNVLHAYAGLNIGTYRTADSRWFRGQMDELALWQRALVPAEVATLLAAGQAQQTLADRAGQSGGESLKTNLVGYYSYDAQANAVVSNSAAAVGGAGFANDGLTLRSTTLIPGAPPIYPMTTNPALARAGTGALNCNGTNSYAHINGNPLDPNQGWSVSAWFKPDTGGAGLSGSARYFVFESAGTTWPVSFGLLAGTNASLTACQVFTETNGSTAAISTNYYLPHAQVDQWHHILLTYNPTNLTLDGYLDNNWTHHIPLVPGSTLQSYGGFNIGTYRSANGRWFNGQIDEVAVWQQTFGTNEVSQLYLLGNAGVSLLASAPQVVSFVPGTAPAGSFTLTWQAVAGLHYSVEASRDLADRSAVVVSNHTAAAALEAIVISPSQPPPAHGYYDPGLSGAQARFYRVRWNP